MRGERRTISNLCPAISALVVLLQVTAPSALGQCPGGGGDCCENNGTPGCDLLECCEAVCKADPFCCLVAWDQICANEACSFFCKGACVCSESQCCVPGGRPGCPDIQCETQVCSIDPSCCSVAWDQGCAVVALELCGICGGTCGADVDGDLDVGVTDLIAVIGAWGTCPGCPEDVDSNAEVGVTDLVALLLAWGPCT